MLQVPPARGAIYGQVAVAKLNGECYDTYIMKIPQNLSQMLPAAYRPAPLAAKPSVLNQQSRFSGLASNAQQSQSQKAEPSFLFKYGGKDINTAGLLNVVG